MEFIVRMSLVCWWLARLLGWPWLHSLTYLRVGWLSAGAFRWLSSAPYAFFHCPHISWGSWQGDIRKTKVSAPQEQACEKPQLSSDSWWSVKGQVPYLAHSGHYKSIWKRCGHGGGEGLAHFCNLAPRLTRHSNESVSLPKVKTSHEMSAASATHSWLAQA